MQKYIECSFNVALFVFKNLGFGGLQSKCWTFAFVANFILTWLQYHIKIIKAGASAFEQMFHLN